MKFLMADILSDDKNSMTVKLTSDLETATMTINKKDWTTKIKGFGRSLKYVYPKFFVDKLVINMIKNNPTEKHFVYGRG
nr:MAG TPA: hypothetical protein [Caudoviricetes sp.]